MNISKKTILIFLMYFIAFLFSIGLSFYWELTSEELFKELKGAIPIGLFTAALVTYIHIKYTPKGG